MLHYKARELVLAWLIQHNVSDVNAVLAYCGDNMITHPSQIPVDMAAATAVANNKMKEWRKDRFKKQPAAGDAFLKFCARHEVIDPDQLCKMTMQILVHAKIAAGHAASIMMEIEAYNKKDELYGDFEEDSSDREVTPPPPLPASVSKAR